MTLSGELKAFITGHQPHGELTGDAGEVTPSGYRLWIACPRGVTFERWVFPNDAAADRVAPARLNWGRCEIDTVAERCSAYSGDGVWPPTTLVRERSRRTPVQLSGPMRSCAPA